ncbi:4867_t:CDS:1, partial [Funneliformis mosseae]
IAECSQATVSQVLKNNQTINKQSGHPQIMTVQKRKKLSKAVLNNKDSRRQSLKEVC